MPPSFTVMPSLVRGNQRTAYLCAFLKALATLSSAISVVPRLRLVESNVCRSHYQTFNHSAINPSTDTVPEGLCKTAQVQTDLAFLLGWDSFFQNIPGLLLILQRESWSQAALLTGLSIPVFIIGVVYSILSERIDRSKLLLINVTSNAVARGYFYAICTRPILFQQRLQLLIWTLSRLFLQRV